MFKVLIVGSGIVGLATGKGLVKRGHQVTYVDTDYLKLESLKQQSLQTMQYHEINWDSIDIVMVCVSTPTGNNGIILDDISSAFNEIGKGLASTENYISVVVRSTLPPTTTEKFLKPILERISKKRLGVDFGLGYNPEFLRHRSSEIDFDQPWIIVFGATDKYTVRVLDDLYTPFGARIVECTPTEAEMIKYVHNIFNAVKISYFNEVHNICKYFNIDSDLVANTVAKSAEGMWNPLYGIRGGHPFTGGCLPKDTEAFQYFCKELGLRQHLLDATIRVNENMKESDLALSQQQTRDEIESTRYQT